MCLNDRQSYLLASNHGICIHSINSSCLMMQPQGPREGGIFTNSFTFSHPIRLRHRHTEEGINVYVLYMLSGVILASSCYEGCLSRQLPRSATRIFPMRWSKIGAVCGVFLIIGPQHAFHVPS